MIEKQSCDIFEKKNINTYVIYCVQGFSIMFKLFILY